MLIVQTADLHLKYDDRYGIKNGIPIHLYYQLKALEHMYEHATEVEADFFVIAGDVFDTPNPSQLLLSIVEKSISSMILKYEGPEIIIVGGNHDYSFKNSKHISAIRTLGNIEGVDVVWDSPEAFECMGINIVCFPYLSKESYNVATPEMASIAYNDSLIANQDENDIGIGHSAYDEVQFKSDEIGHEIYASTRVMSKYKLFMLGHDHKGQSIAKNVIYSGSPYPMNIKQGKHPHGFLIHKVSKKNVKTTKVGLNYIGYETIIIDLNADDDIEKTLAPLVNTMEDNSTCKFTIYFPFIRAKQEDIKQIDSRRVHKSMNALMDCAYTSDYFLNNISFIDINTTPTVVDMDDELMSQLRDELIIEEILKAKGFSDEAVKRKVNKFVRLHSEHNNKSIS